MNFLDSRRGGGPLLHVFLRAFRQNLRFNIHPLIQSSFYVSGQFGSRGEGGTPARRLPEGFFDKVCILIFTPQNRVRSMFLDFLDSRGAGNPYQRVLGGFIEKVCVLIFSNSLFR